jgi:lipopolysaccharide/colanic/teichoic acid biosynthesis glycosyltransferase
MDFQTMIVDPVCVQHGFSEEFVSMSLASMMNQSTTEHPKTGSPKWKSTVDFVLGCVLMILTAPIMVVAMFLIRLTSRGWPIYSQERLGLNGQIFTIYKIRTMYRDCERLSGPRWSTPGDPRVTPIGRFLRSTHIDELPQLVNILRGEMSLVGPRPERPMIAVQLERALPCFCQRLAVRPGVTGLAQIHLPPDTDLNSVRRKLACDLYYIDRATLWLDARLIAATVLGILRVPVVFTTHLLNIPGPEIESKIFGDPSGEMDTFSPPVESRPHRIWSENSQSEAKLSVSSRIPQVNSTEAAARTSSNSRPERSAIESSDVPASESESTQSMASCRT